MASPTTAQLLAEVERLCERVTALERDVEARNRELTTELDRQTATADVLRIIAQSPTELGPVLDAIARSAVRLCAASDAVIERLEGDRFYNAAHAGTQLQGLVGMPLPLTRRFPGGRAVLDRRRVVIDDIQAVAETEFPDTLELLKLNTIRSVAEIPLLSEGKPLGSLAVLRSELRPFTDAEIALLETFADQAVIAIENVRLFKELEARTHELTRSVEQLTALGEVGRAVSSTLDLPTVLGTIVARATSLADVDAGVIYEYDECREIFEPRATHQLPDEVVQAMAASPVKRGEGATGRLAETREPMQLPDIRAITTQSHVRDALSRAGYRALLAVPLLLDDRLIGGLTVIRTAQGAFAPETVDLLRTFATQSALAIQNARLFRELAEKSAELEMASKHKSTFLANMSHELRTPLNAIIGYSEMLQEDASELAGGERLVDDLRKVHAAGRHLLELINAVLDLSKIEAGKMELYLEEIDVAALVRDVVAVIQPLAEKNGNRLEVLCDAGIGAMRADLTKVRQSVFNLLSNACKFTERGTVSLTLTPENRRRVDRVQRRRHGHRHDARAGRSPVRGLLAGRSIHRANVRRDRPGPGAVAPALPDDGRGHHGRERTRARQHVHDATPGDGRGSRAQCHGRSGRGRGVERVGDHRPRGRGGGSVANRSLGRDPVTPI